MAGLHGTTAGRLLHAAQPPNPLAHPPSAGDIAFSVVFALVISWFAWRKARKQAAKSPPGLGALSYLPAIVLGGWAIKLGWDTGRDPTSHNLWPFEFVMIGGGCAVAWFIIGVFQRTSGKDDA